MVMAVRIADVGHSAAEPHVPEGYKQTDVGVIPDDWKSPPVGSVCKLINGRGFKPYEWEKTGLPIIRIQNLNGSDDFNYFQGTHDSKIEVDAGQLLFAWSGSRGTSFGPHVWRGPLGLLNYHTWKVKIDNEKIQREYFLHALRQLTAFIESKAHGASALVHTQKWEMEGFKFPLPPTKVEQEAIAEALSDVDALISSLETLITKKRYIKQGAMQELLRPKDGWVEKKLGDIGIFLKGSGVRKNESLSGEIPCIRYGEIYTVHDDYVKEFHSWISESVASTAMLLKTGDLLFAGSGETKEEIGKCVAFIDKIEAFAGGDIVILRPLGANSKFLGYYLNTNLISKQKASKGQGDAVVHIGQNALADIDIFIPDLPEQIAIATILSDMDAEITALEEKLAKTRQLKKGMMAELLTGRIRLV